MTDAIDGTGRVKDFTEECWDLVEEYQVAKFNMEHGTNADYEPYVKAVGKVEDLFHELEELRKREALVQEVIRLSALLRETEDWYQRLHVVTNDLLIACRKLAEWKP